MKTDKRNDQSRLSQDVNRTSRTMQPNLGNKQKEGPHSNTPSSKAKDSNTRPDWHSDAKGYTRKDTQGKENNDSRK